MALVVLLAFCVWIAMGQPWGRNGLLLLLGLGLAIAYWQVSVTIGSLLIALAVAALARFALLLPLQKHHYSLLQNAIAAAEQRYRHDPCKLGEHYGAIQSLSLAGAMEAPSLSVLCRTISDTGTDLEASDRRIHLPTTAGLANARSSRRIGNLMEAAGIHLLADLSVEARAVRAAMACLQEREGAQQALARLRDLRGDLQETLAKAPDNELLEGSIPQLQEALQRLEQEEIRLEDALAATGAMQRKLHDFLTVPAGIQPILSFDLDEVLQQFEDPRRLADLEALYAEVVELNSIYRDLNREKLA